MNVRKILAAMVACMVLSQSVFAYELNDSEKEKGDKITQRIVSLILKKPEEKRSDYANKIVDQLAKMMRSNKSEKVAALISYVIGGVINSNPNKQNNTPNNAIVSNAQGLFATGGTVSNPVTSKSGAVETQYPGCNTPDIILSNGQIWAACNVGATNTVTKNDSPEFDSIGDYFRWGNNTAIPLDYNAKVDASSNKDAWGASSNSVDAKKGPCKTGYHVPTYAEVSSAYKTFKTPADFISVLRLPFSGQWGYSDYSGITKGYFWLNESENDGLHWGKCFSVSKNTVYIDDLANGGASVRCIRN